MGRKPIGVRAMSHAERTRRWREKHGLNKPVTNTASAASKDAQAEIAALKAEIAALKRAPPPRADSAEALEARIRELEAALAHERKGKARLDRQIEQRVNEEVRRRIDAADDFVREDNKRLSQENLALQRIVGQRGVFTKTQFRQMVMLCHPDDPLSDEVRAELLQLLLKNETKLVSAAAAPAKPAPPPPIDYEAVKAAVEAYAADRTTITLNGIWKALVAGMPALDKHRGHGPHAIEYVIRCLHRLGFTGSESGKTWQRAK
jgi:hypothetical protein